MLLRLRSGTPLRRLAITPLSQPDVLSAVGRRNYGRTITLSTFRHSSSAVRFSIPTYHSYNATSKLCNTQKYSTSSASLLPPAPPSKRSKALRILTVLVGTSIVLFITSQYHEPTRHLILAVQRCQRIGVAVLLSVVDYKRHFARKYANEEEEYEGLRQCHLRSARRILEVLKRNGGIYIKLGQHVSSIYLLPLEWTSTMRPLQDQCYPTPYPELEHLFEKDTGKSIAEQFSEFDEEPVGVASLAQVHVARDKESGKRVAVKIQHPHLEEFARIDLKTTTFLLAVVKYLFPEFEFSWLGEEMSTNLPLEMDFVHETYNARRAEDDFKKVGKTTLYIPEVLRCTKRTMVMEFIEGARVDDLAYLAQHHIDRNRVAQEIQRIFSQMVYINGFFHADPHAGNLLIRPAQPHSRSPYNFEIVLLDHGLYFDIDDELRLNYAHLWLSLIAPASDKTTADRKKYAALVGNIGPDLYPIFESAITGRAGMEGTWDASSSPSSPQRAGSMLDMRPQNEEELQQIREAMMHREGLIVSLFDLLRRVPRRVLMILKLNDLTRNLDNALATTHSSIRIFLIVARYCSLAVYRDQLSTLTQSLGHANTFSLISQFTKEWWRFRVIWDGLRVMEWVLDAKAGVRKAEAWLMGLWRMGFVGARRAAAGLE